MKPRLTLWLFCNQIGETSLVHIINFFGSLWKLEVRYIHCSKGTAEYSNENMCSCSKFHIIKTWQVLQYFFTITFRPESTPDQYNRLYKEFIPMPLHPKDERFCTFHDIFIGGRSCLYYAEIWSKVKGDIFNAWRITQIICVKI